MGHYIGRTLWYMEAMLPGALAALGLFFFLLPWRKHRLAEKGLADGRLREGALLLLWLFCGGMAALTLLPSDWINPLVNLREHIPFGPFFSPGSVNLTLFRTLELGHQTEFAMYIVLGNVVMFIPFGFFAALLWRGFTWKRALLAGICVTGFIECWQLCIGRAFDIDDLLFNALGVFCGFLLWRGLARLVPGLAESFHVHGNEGSYADHD